MKTSLTKYRIVYITPYTQTHRHTHTHTHTHTHIYIYIYIHTNVFNESKKIRSTILRPSNQLYITLSLTYPNHFLSTPPHQIGQHDHLLKVLKLNDSYSASEGGVLYFQTKQSQKIMCSISMHCGNISTYAVKQ